MSVANRQSMSRLSASSGLSGDEDYECDSDDSFAQIVRCARVSKQQHCKRPQAPPVEIQAIVRQKSPPPPPLSVVANKQKSATKDAHKKREVNVHRLSASSGLSADEEYEIDSDDSLSRLIHHTQSPRQQLSEPPQAPPVEIQAIVRQKSPPPPPLPVAANKPTSTTKDAQKERLKDQVYSIIMASASKETKLDALLGNYTAFFGNDFCDDLRKAGYERATQFFEQYADTFVLTCNPDGASLTIVTRHTDDLSRRLEDVIRQENAEKERASASRRPTNHSFNLTAGSRRYNFQF